MPSNKAPGPDGYTKEFFRNTWEIIGDDVVRSIQAFFANGFLPKGVNSTILALIPKNTDAKEMRDYRPISCCNILYKTISKILANRLKRILPEFIMPNQSAFVADRLLLENLLLATELVKDYHKENISARGVLKIDIAKAFDSVQWSFLITVLKAIGLPWQFVKWIQTCISTASFSVQVNGELAGYFPSKRGLRQGCALSPYLFVVSMNVLSAMLNRKAANGLMGYHPRCKGIGLTHLCFADDIMIFTDGIMRSTEEVVRTFDEFAAISCLRISLEKSSCFMAGVSKVTSEAIVSRFNFRLERLPVRYLGLPLTAKRMTVSDYEPLIERIRSKFQSWSTRFLSFAGRLQLLLSVINSITQFWSSAFRLPKRCFEEIDKLCSAFLWSGPEMNGKRAKVSWTEVCKPRKEGGLGFRPLREVNVVFGLKLIWRILSSAPSLWVDWVKRYLLREGSLWKAPKNEGSWNWRKLLKLRNLAFSFTKMVIRDGVSTSFWLDNWLPIGRLIDIAGDRGPRDMGIPLLSSVRTAAPSAWRRRSFRSEALRLISSAVHSSPTPDPTQGQDLVLWRKAEGEFKPLFSTKSTWNQIRINNSLVPWYRAVWFKKAVPKHAFISWLAIKKQVINGRPNGTME